MGTAMPCPYGRRSPWGLEDRSHYCFLPLGSGPPGLLPLGAPDLSLPFGLLPLLLGEPPWPGAAPPGCAACFSCFTLTCILSSSESAGLRTIQSVDFRPCKTSSVVP